VTHEGTLPASGGFTPVCDRDFIGVLALRTPTLPPATHTNTYLFLGEAGELGVVRVALVDPASPYPEEQARLDRAIETLLATGRELGEILLTHHHVDHVSGVAHLVERFGLPVAAHKETARLLGGRLGVTRLLSDGERLPYGSRGMRVLHTPGHAPGHLCFIDQSSGIGVVGDMVASVGTIIIEPEDGGDMSEYLDSLQRLRALELSCLLPAHGPPITDANARLDFYLAHRMEREAGIFNALDATPRPLRALVRSAYPDVSPEIYPLAERSLLAHLIRLERAGRARKQDDGWCRD
jgi:ribonuclease/clavin/mitogillin